MRRYSVMLMLFWLFLSNVEISGQQRDRTGEEKISREAVTVKKYFESPVSSEFKLSPSGEWVAYIGNSDGSRQLYVMSTVKMDANPMTKFTDDQLEDYIWVNEDVLIYTLVNRGKRVIYSIDRNTNKEFVLSKLEGADARFICRSKLDRNVVFIESDERKQNEYDVFRVDVLTGARKLVYQNTKGLSHWIFDSKDRLRVASQKVGSNTKLFRSESAESVEFKEFMSVQFPDVMVPIRFSNKENVLYCISNINRGTKTAMMFDIQENAEVDAIFKHDGYDVDRMNFSDWTDELINVEYIADKREVEFMGHPLDPFVQTLQGTKDMGFIEIESVSEAGNSFVFRSSSDMHPGKYYYYDVSTMNYMPLGNEAPWFNAGNTCVSKAYTFVASDGVELTGYMTYPKVASVENLPVVVMPSWNPTSRSEMDFEPLAQLLAIRGLAVLRLNCRGSYGYGKKLQQLGFSDGGVRAKNDVLDAVNSLISNRVADPKRIGILGNDWSAALSMQLLSEHTSMFACGVSYHDPSSFEYFGQYNVHLNEAELAALFDGSGKKFTQSWTCTSIGCPLFIVREQSNNATLSKGWEGFLQAMRSKNVPVDFFEQDPESDQSKIQDNMVLYSERVLRFLVDNLR